MTWDAYHRRKTVAREIATLADRRRDLTATELLDRVDPRREAFDDEQSLLLDLQLVWFQRLSGECDRNLHDTPEMVAVTAWANASAGLPGIRAVLDRHLDEPVLRRALANERQLLARSGGVSTGRALQLIEKARDRVAVTDEAVDVAVETARPGLISRLRSAMVA